MSITKSPPRGSNHRGHDPRSMALSNSQNTPYGYCQCGCGEKTPLARKTANARGIVRGEPMRFLRGHRARLQLRPTDERFWEKVDRRGPDECWEWTGTRKNGYGRFTVPRSNAPGMRAVYAARFAYEFLVGPIPEGLEIDHLCRNRGCVNPSHLEPVTHRENCRRSFNPAGINARKTHCIHGHEFTPENTIEPKHRPGTRLCRACKNRQAREARRKARQ